MFDRIETLIGDKFNLIKDKTVLIIGLGGVGGYALESLVRSGITKVIIVDNDKVDTTNLNRQIISLNSNISEYKVDVCEKRIKDICKKLKIDDKIEELKNGFNTILVNETSVDDSLKGMLGIARILLKDTKIMLFEEAINGLNSVDKDIVLKILKDLKKNHTIVIISNDDSIVDMADDIIYIKNDHLSSANELYIEDVK